MNLHWNMIQVQVIQTETITILQTQVIQTETKTIQ